MDTTHNLDSTTRDIKTITRINRQNTGWWIAGKYSVQLNAVCWMIAKPINKLKS